MKRRVLSGIGASLVALFGAAQANAETPPELRDLVGARGSSGETQLESRGYTYISTTEGADRKWTYWWNASRQQCISVATVEGRYDSIESTLPPDCGESGSTAAQTSETPEIMVGTNGQGEVIFSRNNCVAYYDARGTRTRQLPACSNAQTRQADDAMSRYRREQGMSG